MELLLLKLDEKLKQQANLITPSVTKNVMEALDGKLEIITEENKMLKDKTSTLAQKLYVMEREKKIQLGLFWHGRNRKIRSRAGGLPDTILETRTNLNSQEIRNIYRIGKNKNVINRPIVVSITSL